MYTKVFTVFQSSTEHLFTAQAWKDENRPGSGPYKENINVWAINARCARNK